jgi:enoyl-CoA hydratase/carnithine racemase
VKSGLIPGMGGLTFLKRQIGLVNVKRLTLLGELLSAEEALAMGLVSHVDDDPLRQAVRLQEDLPNVEAALFMKTVLNREDRDLLGADLELWGRYLTENKHLIDAKRIGDSHVFLSARDRARSREAPADAQRSNGRSSKDTASPGWPAE